VRSPADVFAEHCARGQLAYQVDADGRPVFHPRLGPYEWRVSAGRGTVYATTTVRPRGGEPYDVSLIDLDEGFRMMSRVRGGGTVGQRVTVAFEDGLAVFDPSPPRSGQAP
jgi:uncharacterized OB-fold protein